MQTVRLFLDVDFTKKYFQHGFHTTEIGSFFIRHFSSFSLDLFVFFHSMGTWENILRINLFEKEILNQT